MRNNANIIVGVKFMWWVDGWEGLQHLDGEGQARVVMILKGLPQSTVLVVSQAHSLLAGTFELVDWVIKQHDTATVELAEVYMG
jgi:hypothetical protein